MKFNQLLTLFRERAGLNKKRLAEKLGIKPNYIGDIESGRKKAPTIERCKQIIKILKLTKAEEDEFLDAAIKERTPEEIKNIQTSRSIIGEPQTPYFTHPKDHHKTIEIPIRGACPAGKFNFAFEEIIDTVVLNFDQVRDKSAFALKVSGDCLSGIGVNDGDIVVVSPNAEIKNGDLVIARVGNECTMKKFYKAEEQIILQPCNHDYNPIILNPRKNEVEIIGKVIKALKNFS